MTLVSCVEPLPPVLGWLCNFGYSDRRTSSGYFDSLQSAFSIPISCPMLPAYTGSGQHAAAIVSSIPMSPCTHHPLRSSMWIAVFQCCLISFFALLWLAHPLPCLKVWNPCRLCACNFALLDNNPVHFAKHVGQPLLPQFSEILGPLDVKRYSGGQL